MSKDRKVSNIKSIYINADEQTAIYGLAFNLGIGEWQALHLAICRGLREFDVMTAETYEKQKARYSKSLKERIHHEGED